MTSHTRRASLVLGTGIVLILGLIATNAENVGIWGLNSGTKQTGTAPPSSPDNNTRDSSPMKTVATDNSPEYDSQGNSDISTTDSATTQDGRPPVTPPQFSPSTVVRPPTTVKRFQCKISLFPLNSSPPIRYRVTVTSEDSRPVVMRVQAGSTIDNIIPMSLTDGEDNQLITIDSGIRPTIEVFADNSLSPELLGCRRG